MAENFERQELNDRLSLIESMIAEGRRTTESWGWTFVLWGVAYYIAIAWATVGRSYLGVAGNHDRCLRGDGRGQRRQEPQSAKDKNAARRLVPSGRRRAFRCFFFSCRLALAADSTSTS